MLIETLEDQVQELSKRNQTLQATNSNLRARVDQLESDLAQTRALVTRLENSRVANAALPRINIPDAFAAAAHQESIRNALLAAGAADGASLHHRHEAAFSVGNPPMAASGYLGSPAIINDVLAQREIQNAQVMAERHRRAFLETATLNELRQAHHGQLGLGGLLGQNTVC
jgi:hypothetical protein